MISAPVLVSTAVGACVVALVLQRFFLSKSTAAVPSTPPSHSAVLITGGSRGIGRTTAEYLVSRGYTVIVTVRKQSDVETLQKETAAAWHAILLDVTNDAHVEPAVRRVQAILKETQTQLIAVVNNAGINPEGDAMIEAADGSGGDNKPDAVLAASAVAWRVLDTNVVGVMRVTRAFLPLLPSQQGRIINLGSYFGSVAGMAGLSHAAYETSKFALEGLSDNLRRSLRKQGIAVSLIKPGNIQTDMNTVYGEVKADVVARDIEHAVASPHPRARYYPGKVQGIPCRLLCFLFEMLPSGVTDRF